MKTKTDPKIIVIILLCVSVILILSFILLTKSSLNLNGTPKSIIYGIATGIITFSLTFYITQKLFFEKNDKFNELIKKFEPHNIDAKTILNTVQKKSIALVELDRNKLLGTGFYEENYSKADDIRISGITVNALIKYLCNPSSIDSHLINQLKLKKNVKVKIVFMHPDSKIVDILNRQEHPTDKVVSDKIKESIDQLKVFTNRKSGKLEEGSSIEIVITLNTMNFTISYAGNVVRDKNDKLLLGFLFGSKVGGPIYQVPNIEEISMFDDCLHHFDELFKEGHKIFSWTGGKKTFFPIN